MIYHQFVQDPRECGACSACERKDCSWRSGMGALTDRPDKTGVVFRARSQFVVDAQEIWEKAAQSPRAAKMLAELQRRALVVIRNPQKLVVSATGPKGLADKYQKALLHGRPPE